MLINIQLLRFLAALAVVFTHGHAHVVAANGPQDGLFGFFHLFGYAGVDVFFVISGFIIWHTTTSLHGGRGAADFLYRRATRIYTGYWPYALLALLLFWVFGPEVLKRIDYWGSFLLYSTKIDELLLPVAWTLVYELYFYLVFTLLLLFSNRFRLLALVVLFAVVLTVQGVGWLYLDLYSQANFWGLSIFFLFFTSPFCLEFLAGAMLAAGYQRLRPNPWLLFTLFLLFLVGGIYLQEAVIGERLEKGYHAPYRVLFFGSAALFLVWAMLRLEQLGRVLAPRYGLFLGDISYSLYLSHTLLLTAIYFFGLRDLAAETGYQEVWYLLFSLLIIAYSALHYRWIEYPLRSLSQRLRRVYLARWPLAGQGGRSSSET